MDITEIKQHRLTPVECFLDSILVQLKSKESNGWIIYYYDNKVMFEYLVSECRLYASLNYILNVLHNLYGIKRNDAYKTVGEIFSNYQDVVVSDTIFRDINFGSYG